MLAGIACRQVKTDHVRGRKGAEPPRGTCLGVVVLRGLQDAQLLWDTAARIAVQLPVLKTVPWCPPCVRVSESRVGLQIQESNPERRADRLRLVAPVLVVQSGCGQQGSRKPLCLAPAAYRKPA